MYECRIQMRALDIPCARPAHNFDLMVHQSLDEEYSGVRVSESLKTRLKHVVGR